MSASVRAWILAARPATLWAAVVPVAVGTACAVAVGRFRAVPAIAALLGAVMIQIGTNFANDVFDFEKGADDERRIGPTRAVQAGLVTPRAMRFATALAFGAATLAGVYLTAIAGWPIVAIGVTSILAGIAYTGGPVPLGYVGLGDVLVLAFFGFVAVCGTAFVQVGGVPEIAWWASLPVGAFATAILVVNNLRDRKTDATAGKRTLAVRLGRRGAVLEYATLVGVSYAVPVALFVLGDAHAAVLLPIVTLPFAVKRVVRVASDDGAALNASLGGTARLMLAHGALFATGLALGPAL